MVAVREYAQVDYLIAAFSGLVAGTAVHYVLAKAHVFDRSILRSQALEFVAYGALGAVSMLASLAVIYIGTTILGVDYRISKAPAAAASFLLGYFTRKHLLFRNAMPSVPPKKQCPMP